MIKQEEQSACRGRKKVADAQSLETKSLLSHVAETATANAN